MASSEKRHPPNSAVSNFLLFQTLILQIVWHVTQSRCNIFLFRWQLCTQSL